MSVPPDDLKTDCRHFRWDRPCAPHKLRGRVCAGCSEHDPVGHRVLIVKLAQLGDVLRTTGFLPAIHAAFPGAHVTWLTQPAARDLFDGNELVDAVLTWGDALASARLAVEEFDVILCPDADPQAAVLAAAARGRVRRGFTMDERGRVVPLGAGAEHWFRMGLSDPLKKANDRTYQELVAAVLELDPAGVAAPILVPRESDRDAARAARAELSFDGPLIGLNTGAGGRWEYKAWTLEHQRTFLDLATAGGAGVLLLGGPDEQDRHVELTAALPGRPVFDGGNHNGFGRFAALLELCDVVVTGDTFGMHVATARSVPAVVLFGPTSAAEIELFGRGAKLQPEAMDCLVCYLPKCAVTPHCQARILPEVVWREVQRFLPRR